MVRNDTTLSSVVKLQHLLSCLDGEPARRVKSLQLIGSNFSVAWDTLTRRYDNPRVRLSAHMRRLLNMPAATGRTANDITSLMDGVAEAIRAFTLLGRPVEHWDDWFLEIVISRLEPSIREDWEKSLEGKADLPSYQELSIFLENRARTLDAANACSSTTTNHHPSSSSTKSVSYKKAKSVSAHYSASASVDKSPRPPPGCSLCKGRHYLAYCPTFLRMDATQKMAYIGESRSCRNCLRVGHLSNNCPSQSRCRATGCQAQHHSLLHDCYKEESSTPATTQSAREPVRAHTTNLNKEERLNVTPAGSMVFLATASIILESPLGAQLTVRALVDPASEGSFVSEHVVQFLTLAKKRQATPICGVGDSVNLTSQYISELVLRSKQNANFSLNFSAYVLRKLTSILPRRECAATTWKHLRNIQLADENFHQPARIDCILGADVYPAIILPGLRRGPPRQPVAQNTTLGWIVTGYASTPPLPRSTTCRSHFTSAVSLDYALSRFWEIEEVHADKPGLTQEEKECEEHFSRTHTRDKEGRYVLRLPFSQTPRLPGSLAIATARLLQTERRLQSNPTLLTSYTTFMKEILQLHHMERVPEDERMAADAYYMPHHAVLKQDGSGKIRVVFNASQSTRSGQSLNDCLHVGPKLQSDISAILSRWRDFRFVFSADIVKMFRQFKLHRDDLDWLRIVWRNDPSEELQHYRMTTVVYGTACAPYQANRALLQLAKDERESFPRGAHLLENHVYVDDVLAGGDTLEDALLARNQLINILTTAGMKLDKWSSNHAALLPDASTSTTSRLFSEANCVSALGLHWNPAHDCFTFRVNLGPLPRTLTKRSVLSEVARLFDPLGWLAPVVVVGKMLIQQLWLTNRGWDDELDGETAATWSRLRSQLPFLESLRIPRWLGMASTSTWYLHGFSDASQRAYAASIYIVVRNGDALPTATLFAAKTKVAPLKALSIPRLELCGALLLARLVESVKGYTSTSPNGIFCWSDSQVVLAWLDSHPSRWKVFVANRTSEITTLLPSARWGHVRTKENPADLASRGISPTALKEEQLWWNGPDWLTSKWERWNVPTAHISTELEERKQTAVFTTTTDATSSPIEQLIARFSNLKKLIRVVARLLRWKLREPKTTAPHASVLTATELSTARWKLVRSIQQESFYEEIDQLRKGKRLSKTSKLKSFVPFLDAEGTLRVGGRLQHAFLLENEKHPAIVPNNSHLAELLIRGAHERTLYGGPQLMQSHLLRAYWIIHARSRVRRVASQCTRCTRFRRQTLHQQMAPLPSVRVTPSRPFYATGLDYAGHFYLRTTKGRGHKAFKGYVAIFVCMATRAIHLEVVSDCTSQSFLAAFRRFVARRGLCRFIYSDNATNFQGADAELQRLFHEASEASRTIVNALAPDGIEWRFIPPRAPHFGGLLEAGVRSFKHHLRRVLGDNKLTYEEFSTLAAQIEACLNSRPLSPLSTDPADNAALTPGHFLVGSALTALPEPSTTELSVLGPARYRLTTQMRDHFWQRWQKEVLHQLQQRSKWLEASHSIQEGDLVLVTDELLPPTKWPLARVERCHHGPDELTRVLTLRTATTTLQRPLVKVVRLPVDPPASETD